jgi:aminobenzoyl-glutamate utilization protein A
VAVTDRIAAPIDATLVTQAVTDSREHEHTIVRWRRDLHQHPEPGFGEFRTAALIQRELDALGLTVRIGGSAMDVDAIYSCDETRIEASAERARQQGVDSDLVDQLQREGTAVVADLVCGEGPTVAFRVDMDCLPVTEASDVTHLPAREGFRSLVEGEMHACGHDGHVAIGLGVASLLAKRRSSLTGTARFIFQPAEEGALGGARAITARGLVDDVDYLIAIHLGLGYPTGEVVARARFLVTSKFRARLAGAAAHVVNAPETGRNALLAAATAALGLHAIAPHGQGWFSVNVGVLRSGDEQGVTPAWALMDIGVWAETQAAHDYVVARVHEILHGAGSAHGVEVDIEQIGGAPAADDDEQLGQLVSATAAQIPDIDQVRDLIICRAGEDATVFLNRIAEQGRRGVYVLIGSDLAAGHHAHDFDFDERSLVTGTAMLTAVAGHLLQREVSG